MSLLPSVIWRLYVPALVGMVVTRPWAMSLAQVTPAASSRLPRAVAAALAVPMTEV